MRHDFSNDKLVNGVFIRLRSNGTHYHKISSPDRKTLDGVCTWYHCNGRIRERSMWSGNKQIGEQIIRHKNGKLRHHRINTGDRNTSFDVEENLTEEDKIMITLRTGAKWLPSQRKRRIG